MTIEEKAKAYDEALKRADKVNKGNANDREPGITICEYIFPEIKGNEDERIRKALICGMNTLKNNQKKKTFADIPLDNCIAWLEKQKNTPDKEYVFRPVAGCDIAHAATQAIEHQQSGYKIVLAFNGAYIPVEEKTADDIVNEYYSWIKKQAGPNPYSGVSFEYNGHAWGMCARDNGIEIVMDGIPVRHFSYKDCEHVFEGESALESIKEENVGNQNCIKSANKIKQKFNEGDYIVPYNITSLEIWKVINIDDDGYYNIQPITNPDDDEIYRVPAFTLEEDYYLWSLNDAHYGDVLVDEDNNIGIYVGEKDDLYWYSCIYLGCDNCIRGFNIGGCHKRKNTKPATKEQRELLFSKMKQEGYELDNKKKELSKQTLKITPKFCVGQLITDDNGTWYQITNIKCLDNWYYEVYDICEGDTHFELCSIIDEKFRENRFVSEIKKMIRD